MLRSLLLVSAVAGLTSIGCLSVAFALGAPQFGDSDWWGWHSDHRHGPAISGDGPTVSRTLTWGGGDSLSVDVSADVEYTQGPTASLVVTGPKGAVDNLVLDGDQLSYDHRMHSHPRLKIVMTAPDVEEFNLNGSQSMRIAGFDHARMEVNIHGSSNVVALGKTEELELNVAGSGDADLGAVTAKSADVNILGSGRATIAPTDKAEVNIAGSGDLNLATRPPHLETHIAGSGHITQPSDSAAPAKLAPAPVKATKTALPPGEFQFRLSPKATCRQT